MNNLSSWDPKSGTQNPNEDLKNHKNKHQNSNHNNWTNQKRPTNSK